MRVGVVVAQEFWMHFRQIYAALEYKHQVSIFHQRKWPYQLFSGRIDRALLKYDLRYFIKAQDVVVFEWAEELFVQATKMSLATPLVVRLHLHELWDYAPQVNWDNTKRIILVSQAMQRKFIKRYPQMVGCTQVVLNGVVLDKFVHQKRTYHGVLGTLSRLEPHKGIYELICVFSDLRKQGYDMSLKIGGTCTEPRYQRYADEVHLLVERLGIAPYVEFNGFVEDTGAWYKGIDIFISNSTSEGLQVALLEAMASGCFSLSQNWDGAEEVLPPENLYFTQREIIEKLRWYSDLSEANKQLERQKMRAIAEERFDIKDKVQRVVEIIEEAAAI